MEGVKITHTDKSVSHHPSFAKAGRVAPDSIDSQSITSENKSVVFKKPFRYHGTSPASRKIIKNSPIVVGSLGGLKTFRIVPQKYLKINNGNVNRSASFSSIVTHRVPPINSSRIEDMNAIFNEVTGNVKLFHSKAKGPSSPPKASDDVYNIRQESNIAPPAMTIVNQYNGLNHSSRTVAKLNSGTESDESDSFTSDNLVNLIGQENYNILFAALCTISSAELKHKAIRSLLTKRTANTAYNEISVQTPNWDRQYILTHDISCQTTGKVLKDKSVNTDPSQDFKMNSSSFTSRQFKKRRRCPTRRQSPYVIDTRNLANRIDHKKMMTEDNEKVRYQRDVVVHKRKIPLPPPNGKFKEESGYCSLESSQSSDHKIAQYPKEAFKENNAKSLKGASTSELEKDYVNKTTKSTEKISVKSFNIFDIDSRTDLGCPSMNGTSSLSICSDSLDISESLLNDPFGNCLNNCLNSVTKPIECEMNDLMHNEHEKSSCSPVTESRTQEPFGYGNTIFRPDHLELMNSVKPKDKFHLVSKDLMKSLSPDKLKQLVNLQMLIDWQYCMDYDEFGFLPIHNAVQNNDIPLLQRQCLVLKSKGENVDVGDEQSDMSPLQLAVTEGSDFSCIKALLKHGANMLYKDDTSSTVLHYCVVSEDDQYIHFFVTYMEQNPNDILKAAGLKTHDDNEVNKQHVLRSANSIYNENGLTPLMLAASLGCPHIIGLLLEMTSSRHALVNTRCVKSGDTALMLAVKSACTADPNNRSTVPEKYLGTIEKLLSYGADPEIENYAGLNVAGLVSEHQIPSLINVVSGTKSFKTVPHKSPSADKLAHTKNCIPAKQIKNKVKTIENLDEHRDGNKTVENLDNVTQLEITYTKMHNKPKITNVNSNTGNLSNPMQKMTLDNLNAVSVIKVVDSPVSKSQMNNIIRENFINGEMRNDSKILRVLTNDGKTLWRKIQCPADNNAAQRIEKTKVGTQIKSNLNVNKNIVIETTQKSSTATSNNINSKTKPSILQNINVISPLNTSMSSVPANSNLPTRFLPKMVPKTNFSISTVSNKIVINPTDVGIISRPVSTTVCTPQNVIPVQNIMLNVQKCGSKLNDRDNVTQNIEYDERHNSENDKTKNSQNDKSQNSEYDNADLIRKPQTDANLANVTQHVQTQNANSVATLIHPVNTKNVGKDNDSLVWIDYSKLDRNDVQKKLKFMKSLPIIATGLNSGNRQNQLKNFSDTLKHIKGVSYVQPSQNVVAVNQIVTSTELSSEVTVLQNSLADSSKSENLVCEKLANTDLVNHNNNPLDNYGKLKQLGQLLDEKSKIKMTVLKSESGKKVESAGQNFSNSTVENVAETQHVDKTEICTAVLGKRPKKMPKRYSPDNISSPSRPKYKRNSSSSDS